MDSLSRRLIENLERVKHRLSSACARAGRNENDVTLVAVTKSAEPESIRALVELDVTDLAENRPQQLLERAAVVPSSVRWHLIGHLQRNKVRKIVPAVAMIHSVDSLRLLTTLDSLARELETSPRVLLEVNVSGEATKGGFAPEELLAQAEAVDACRSVRIEGLMTMVPYSDDPEQARPVFRALREFRDRLAPRLPHHALRELSMGMSGDFEPAVEEGATIVRIGSSLFEGVDKSS